MIVTLAIFLLILDLVRRRRLAERYALLWMLAAAALLVLSIWTNGLDVIADAMGIQQPANAIFILAFGVIFVLLLHFSVATTRLAEETKILAQEIRPPRARAARGARRGADRQRRWAGERRSRDEPNRARPRAPPAVHDLARTGARPVHAGACITWMPTSHR